MPEDRFLPRTFHSVVQVRPGAGHEDAGPPVLTGAAACSRKKRVVHCEVPAGILDLRIEVEDFAPVYRWGITVAPSGDRSLGNIRLIPGASFRGSVLDAATRAPLDEAAVELRPTGLTADRDFDHRERSRVRRFRAETDARGFFQITGVTPAVYEVRVSREGTLGGSRTTLDVGEIREYEIDGPLLWAPPASLEVHLNPPLDPYGQPWRIRLARHLRGVEAESVGGVPATANPAGTWSAHGLGPGTYLIQVGNELDPSWRMERIEVGSDDEILDFLLDAVAIRGELTLAGEPVIGTLWFGGRHGEESIRFDTGEEGEFRGYLPREGDWRVELSRPGWFGVQNLPPVTVERSSGQSVARVRIELPDTTLRGRVIDTDGQPKPGARLLAVDVQKASRELTEVADEEGRFEFRGLDEATLSMRAESPEGSSDWIPVRIEEGQEGPEVVLRIAERRTIRGRVVSPSGPVADATVVLTPVSTGQAPVAVIEENTRVDGTFEVQVPHHVRVLSVLVLPPGFAAKVFLHALARGPGSGSGGESMDIQVSGQGGTLGLVPVSSPNGARTSGLILHDGAVVGLEDLGRWARLQGERPAADGRIRIPRIESGWYRLCRVSSPSPAEDQGAPRCDEGFLPEGGELTLSVETRQEAKR